MLLWSIQTFGQYNIMALINRRLENGNVFYDPTTPVDSEYRGSIREINNFFYISLTKLCLHLCNFRENKTNCVAFLEGCILVETQISITTHENWFSKYSIRFEFLKLKIFLFLQYRHVIHLFDDDALQFTVVFNFVLWCYIH